MSGGNFLCTAVSGGSRGLAVRAVGAGVWARIGGLQELSIYTAVSGGSRGRAGAERGAVRAVGVVWAEGVWARL